MLCIGHNEAPLYDFKNFISLQNHSYLLAEASRLMGRGRSSLRWYLWIRLTSLTRFKEIPGMGIEVSPFRHPLCRTVVLGKP